MLNLIWNYKHGKKQKLKENMGLICWGENFWNDFLMAF